MTYYDDGKLFFSEEDRDVISNLMVTIVMLKVIPKLEIQYLGASLWERSANIMMGRFSRSHYNYGWGY